MNVKQNLNSLFFNKLNIHYHSKKELNKKKEKPQIFVVLIVWKKICNFAYLLDEVDFDKIAKFRFLVAWNGIKMRCGNTVFMSA